MKLRQTPSRFAKSLESSFGVIGASALLTADRHFLVIGTDENHDVAVFGQTPFAVPMPRVLPLRKGARPACDVATAMANYEAFQRAIQTPQVAAFSLRPIDVNLMRRIIRHCAITHLRFFAVADGGVTVHAFDYRKCFGSVRLRRKAPMRIYTHERTDQSARPFSVTLKASAFLRLPAADVSLSLRESGVVACEWVGVNYRVFLGDQGIVEPIAVFSSDAAKEPVALMLIRGD